MSHDSDDKAVCRGCGLVLNGKPYYMGGFAYHPRTGNRCPSNYYGGFVCSERCDRKASLELEQSMPGHVGQLSIGSDARQKISDNWPEVSR